LLIADLFHPVDGVTVELLLDGDMPHGRVCCRDVANYCWKLIADGVAQRRVSVVVLGVNPPARKVQHSSSVEQ